MLVWPTATVFSFSIWQIRKMNCPPIKCKIGPRPTSKWFGTVRGSSPVPNPFYTTDCFRVFWWTVKDAAQRDQDDGPVNCVPSLVFFLCGYTNFIFFYMYTCVNVPKRLCALLILINEMRAHTHVLLWLEKRHLCFNETCQSQAAPIVMKEYDSPA